MPPSDRHTWGTYIQPAQTSFGCLLLGFIQAHPQRGESRGKLIEIRLPRLLPRLDEVWFQPPEQAHNSGEAEKYVGSRHTLPLSHRAREPIEDLCDLDGLVTLLNGGQSPHYITSFWRMRYSNTLIIYRAKEKHYNK